MPRTCGVAIPSIPPRSAMLRRAIDSVLGQTWPPDQISIAVDHHGEGAAATRNRALDAISTDWVAFLDDDDEFLPLHLERCVTFATDAGLDLVYPWFEGINQGIFRVPNEDGVPTDPFGMAWHPGIEAAMREGRNHIPVTVVVRTEAIKAVGGFGIDEKWGRNEDHVAWMRLLDAGYKFGHLPERTWRWNGHPNHTGGVSWSRMDA